MERPQSITRASQSPRLVSIEHENYTTPKVHIQKLSSLMSSHQNPQAPEWRILSQVHLHYLKKNEKPYVPIKIPLVPIKISLNRQHFSISWPAGVVTLGLSHLDIARLERLEGEGWTFGKGQIIDQPFIWAIMYIYILYYGRYILYYGIYIYLFPVFFLTLHYCFQLLVFNINDLSNIFHQPLSSYAWIRFSNPHGKLQRRGSEWIAPRQGQF